MGVLRWLRRVYSLDTLDTRLTVPSTAPAKLASGAKPQSPAQAEKGSSMHQQHASSVEGESNGGHSAPQTVGKFGAQPSKWKTPEFYFYYVVFAICVPMMFKSVIDVSQPSHPAYARYSVLLSDGWIPGRKVDNSDVQYAGVRNNYPALFLFLVFHPLLRRLVDAVTSFNDTSGSPRSRNGALGSEADLEARMKRRVRFDYYFGFAFVILLCGISVFKILAILAINFSIATKLPRNRVPLVTWVFNISILFVNELCKGYPFGEVARSFSRLLMGNENVSLITFGQLLDSYGGLVPRWEVFFKVTILRLISFNMDYYWSRDFTPSSPVEKRKFNPAMLSERERVSTPAPATAYNFTNFVAYVLYSPLYISGPIITFNDYISQSSFKPPSITRTRTTLYAIRFLLSLLCMELMLHYIHVVAISRAMSYYWAIYTPFQLSMLGFFNLHHIWLKLLLPWRFFRLWALLDGIDPPENMIRCVSNNYSALAFWRSWHRSFNRWVVRYLYIPLGGGANRSDKPKNAESPLFARARAIFNFLVVFTFVAIWHDINLRLLMWSWLITLFVLPEVVATILFPPSRWKSNPTAYRMLCGVGAVANILMMMTANLVGFALGLDGMKGLIEGIVGSSAGIAYMIAACGALFVGAQVMFEIREGELRAGIRLKC